MSRYISPLAVMALIMSAVAATPEMDISPEATPKKRRPQHHHGKYHRPEKTSATTSKIKSTSLSKLLRK